jgi:aarF domain-containing kinase
MGIALLSPFLNLDQVTTAEVLAFEGASCASSPSANANATPVKRGWLPPSPTSDAGSSRASDSPGDRAWSVVSQEERAGVRCVEGDIWGAAERASAAALCYRGSFLLLAFLPVFFVSVPLLVLSEKPGAVRAFTALGASGVVAVLLGLACVVAGCVLLYSDVGGGFGSYQDQSETFGFAASVATGNALIAGPGLCALALLFCAIFFTGGDSASSVLARKETKAAMRRRAWKTLHAAVSNCGAALVKWAQWASVRRDIFPEDFCEAMSALHDDAPRHSRKHTEKIIREEFGVPSGDVFQHFPPEPVASGSIAQVYRCVLKPEVARACAARDPELARRLREQRGKASSAGAGEQAARSLSSRGRGGTTAIARGGSSAEALASAASDAAGCVVAVKVRHPGVARQIFLDFQILKRAARLASGVFSLKGINLEETLGQFSHSMTAQTDLRTEAKHLRRFGRNFRKERQVNAPWPVPGLVTEGVLVETFERGEALSSTIRRGCEHNKTLCAHGVDAYLKMLLRDNFLHSDLHPGNILFHLHQISDADPSASAAALNAIKGEVRLVLLDFGIADELPQDVRDRFLTFLFSLVREDGPAATDAILGWSSDQKCVGAAAEALRADMTALIRESCRITKQRVDIDAVLKKVLTLLRRHGVSVDAVYASLVVSMCVLVGFANALDDELCLFEVAVSAFMSYSVTGEVVGKLFEK